MTPNLITLSIQVQNCQKINAIKMKPRIYLFSTVTTHQTDPFVSLEDFQELEKKNKTLASELQYFQDYCNRLVEIGDLPCLPKDLENLREANLSFAMENERLRNELYRIGICPDCEKEYCHHVDEPFSSCECGTSEDGSGPSIIQELRTDNVKLLELSETYKKIADCLSNELRESNIKIEKFQREIERLDALKEQISFLAFTNEKLLERQRENLIKYDNDKLFWETKLKIAQNKFDNVSSFL